MSSPRSAVLGVQEPTYQSLPPAHSTEQGKEAVEFCASFGLYLDPWQSTVLGSSLHERADYTWAASDVGLIVPRQNGKGSILEGRELSGLFLFNEGLILHSAHEFKTSTEAFLRVKAHIDNYDALRSRVKSIRSSHGEEGIELLNGNRLRFVARSRGSGRGFSGDLVILDEAYALTDIQLDALLPTLSARPNPQVWYTSSAPLPDSLVLRRLCARGRAGNAERLAYSEWCCTPDMDRAAHSSWARANPALGRRLSIEKIQAEFEAMSPDGFDRERLGIWSENERQRVLKHWSQLADPNSKIVGGMVFAVDISPTRDRACISVGGRSNDGRQHVETIDNREDAHWVIPRFRELVAKWGNLTVILDDKSSAGSLISELDSIPEITLIRPTFRELAAGCARLYDACGSTTKSLVHLGQANLDQAVDGAITRSSGDAWLWDRRRPDVDITPLTSVTLAFWGITEGHADFDISAQVF